MHRVFVYPERGDIESRHGGDGLRGLPRDCRTGFRSGVCRDRGGSAVGCCGNGGAVGSGRGGRSPGGGLHGQLDYAFGVTGIGLTAQHPGGIRHGEYTDLAASGVLSISDGLRLVPAHATCHSALAEDDPARVKALSLRIARLRGALDRNSAPGSLGHTPRWSRDPRRTSEGFAA